MIATNKVTVTVTIKRIGAHHCLWWTTSSETKPHCVQDLLKWCGSGSVKHWDCVGRWRSPRGLLLPTSHTQTPSPRTQVLSTLTFYLTQVIWPFDPFCRSPSRERGTLRDRDIFAWRKVSIPTYFPILFFKWKFLLSVNEQLKWW
jgi:hypothetical protein